MNALQDRKRIGVVLIGHGSRRADANLAFLEYVAAYRARRPEFHVSHGYIELATPFMGDAIEAAAAHCDQVVVAPMLLFRSGHAKNDLPLVIAAARRNFPDKSIVAADTLGVHPALADLAFERAAATGLAAVAEKTAIVFVGRGSSDPDANGDFFKQARVFAEGRNFGWMVPCFIGITTPLLDRALDLVARARPDRLVVVPYFLLTGVLIERIRERLAVFQEEYPWMTAALAEPLGLDDRVLDVLDQRVGEALNGGATLPCDSCKFRVALPGQSEHLGGLKALLWSVRHTFTHNQAMPHEHAHKPVQKHVLVCGNVDCAAAGSIKMLAALRSGLKRRDLLQKVLVTQTSCMGHCGAGPNVVVYPDGIWYRGVQADDAEELIEEHLLNDRLLARLVDNIM